VPASADGVVFAVWKTNQSPGSFTSFVLQGREVKRHEGGGYLGHLVPGPDGKVLCTAAGLYTNQFAPLSPKERNPGYCLPALQGNYYVALTSAEAAGKGGALSVYLLGHDRPVAKFDRFDHGLTFDGWDRVDFGPWKRVFFSPQAGLIIVLPGTNDRLVLHRFDVNAALESSGIDYLLVASRPVTTVKRGSVYNYPLVVKSKRGGVTYRLDSGPAGMTISPEGLLCWSPPADLRQTDHDVILTIREAAGQEVFHTFTIQVVPE
jgi:hypothetical protein